MATGGSFLKEMILDLKSLFGLSSSTKVHTHQNDAKADSSQPTGLQKKSRKARLLQQRDIEERRFFEESTADLKLRIELIKESQRAYRGQPGIDYKQPAHHSNLEKRQDYVTPSPEELAEQVIKGMIVGEEYKEQNIQRTSRWTSKPSRILENLLTNDELRETMDKEKYYIPGRHHNYYGESKIFAVPGNQQTIKAIYNEKLGVVPQFEQDRLLPDPNLRLIADVNARKKKERLWAPIKRIKASVLNMARSPVRLLPEKTLCSTNNDASINDLNQSSCLDAASFVGSIATVTDLDEQSAAAYGRRQQEQHPRTVRLPNISPVRLPVEPQQTSNDFECDTAAADRSLFSEFSIDTGRVHIPVKMVKIRTIRGLDGKKVRGLKLESLSSVKDRSVKRKEIRYFNLRLASALQRASKHATMET